MSGRIAARYIYAIPVVVSAIVMWVGSVPVAYAGDASSTGNGTLIATISTPAIDGKPVVQYVSIALEIRRIDRTDSDAFANNAANWLMSDKDDFVDAGEAGMVFTRTLPPGDWEVYSYFTNGAGGVVSVQNYFSIPFAIKPGRATYIGDFEAIATTAKNFLGMEVDAGARMVVTDKSARDIPIAQMKDPSLGPVDISVSDVDKLDNPQLAAHNTPPVPESGDGPSIGTNN